MKNHTKVYIIDWDLTSQKLRKLMRINDINGRALSEKLHVHPSIISLYVHGKGIPIDKIYGMSLIFNVSVDYLLNLSDEPNINHHNVEEAINDNDVINDDADDKDKDNAIVDFVVNCLNNKDKINKMLALLEE